MDDIAASIEHLRRSAKASEGSEKRAAWNALQQHCPQFVPTFRQFCDVFGGVESLTVEANGQTTTYGTPDPADGWINPQLGEPYYTQRKGEI